MNHMENKIMPVPPRTFRWGRNLGTIAILTVLATTLAAQDVPPVPGGGTNAPPYNPTPEELAAQQKALEAFWQSNRERFAPYLHTTPAPAPEDLVLKQRLMSAEIAERQRKVEEAADRDANVLAWAADQKKMNDAAQAELHKRVPQKVIDEFAKRGIRLDFRDGRIVGIKSMDVEAQKTIGAWKAKTNAPSDYPLNFSGQLVGLWEYSVPDTNHVEFNNGGIPRLIYIDTGTNVDRRDHATEMAGTIEAAGIMTDAEGVASTATILASDSDGDTDEMGTYSVSYGLRLSNHSYGSALGWDDSQGVVVWYGPTNDGSYDDHFGAYLTEAANLDSLAYLHKGYLSVWAAGNDRDDGDYSGSNHYHADGTLNLYHDNHVADQAYFGGYRTITPEGVAKNIITVGSINDQVNGWQGASGVTNSSFSDRGPTRDGRTKPDLVAGGESVYSASANSSSNHNVYNYSTGTSPAAAAVTGAIALIRERFAEVGNPDPSAALVKTVIMATGHDAGPVGPDYQFGPGGVMDTSQAVDLILTNKYFYNAGGGLLKSVIYEGVLTNGTTLNFIVNKNPDTTISAMLGWTDPAGYVNAGSSNLMLVNDLDVKIIQSGSTNLSYALDPGNPTAAATRTGNSVDNVELNVLTNNWSGQITIQVSHKGTLKDAGYQGNTTNQDFVLVVTGQVLNPVPEIVDIAQTSSNQVTLEWTGNLYHYYKAQYIDEVDALASAWTDATGSIYMTNNPAAVALTLTNNPPNRFYRMVQLP
ncbi:S8 family serine peptidase [bacterium]|nr:S8 family serine peptidase [bacterium]